VTARRPALPAALAGIAVALAAPAAFADDVPVVDVADLPPLPPPSEDRSQTATLYAAGETDEDIVVGAAKREQSLGNVASAVTVISGDRLRRFGYRTVAEALRAVAGVHVADDHLTERVGIRGLQILGDFNTRILVLIDGATLNEMWGAFAGLGWDIPVAIDDVARIEVIRGPVSSVYGTNAFFGIVNIVTRGAAETPRAWGRVTGSTFAGGSLAAGFAVGGVDRQLRGSVVGQVRRGETLPFNGMELSGVDGMESIGVNLVGAYQGAFAQLRFYHRARELPFAPFDSVLGDDRTREFDTLGIAEGGYTREVSKRLTVSGRGYFNVYRFSDFLIEEGMPDDPFRDFGDALWFGGEVRGRFAIVGDRLGVTAGGEAMRVQTESRSYPESAAPADRVVIPKDFSIQGLYAEADAAPTSWLSATAGVRFDRNSILEDRVSPRAAVFLADKDRFGLKLLYAEGFRNPSAFEAFFADGTDFEANPDVGAETIRSFEAVAWGRPLPGISARVSGFTWNAKGLVEQEIDPANGLLRFVNIGQARSAGVEAEVTYRDSRGWYAFAGGAVQRVRDGDDVRIIGAPAVTGSVGVSTPRLFGIGHVSTEVNVVGPRTTRDPAVEARAFAGWNAAIYVPDLRGFDVTIGARNLIGKREQVPGQEDYDRTMPPPGTVIPTLPGEGTEVYARVGYRFE
jgi:outer membrane receptor for ferrienterochelin and colicins